MATNDFIIDLVEKLQEDNLEYLVIYVQKGKLDSHANAYFDIVTQEGAEMIGVTVDEVFNKLENPEDDLTDGEEDIDNDSPYFDENEDSE